MRVAVRTQAAPTAVGSAGARSLALPAAMSSSSHLMSIGDVMTSLRLTLLLTQALFLHIPVLLTRGNASRGRAPRLPDGAVSFAFFGAIDEVGESRTVRVKLRGDQQLFVELLVPELSPEKDLPEEDLPSLTITSPSGAETVCTASCREIFDEPHSGTSYLRCFTERFPAAEGTYTLSVTAAAPARFVLAVGEDERPGDVLDASIGSIDDVDRWYRTDPAVCG